MPFIILFVVYLDSLYVCARMCLLNTIRFSVFFACVISLLYLLICSYVLKYINNFQNVKITGYNNREHSSIMMPLNNARIQKVLSEGVQL